jgi:hypothetical protein
MGETTRTRLLQMAGDYLERAVLLEQRANDQ